MRLEEEIRTSKFQNEIHKAHINIIFSAGWLRGRINASLKPFGLTQEQFNVMRIVRGAMPEGVRVKDITRRMLERSSNTTRIIDRLELKGLLQRLQSARDRRERAIELTAEGIALLEIIERDWEKNTPHYTTLTTQEAAQLNELLDKMRS